MTESEVTDLYRRRSGAVLRYCAFRLDSRADAEDATAEVFARLIVHGDRVRPDRRERWLFAVARNVCSDRARIRARESASMPAEHEQHLDPSWVDPSIRAAVMRLTRAQQEVVFLRVFEDLSFAEIGRLRGRREVAVRVQYHRAVTRLRVLLKEVDPCLETELEAE